MRIRERLAWLAAASLSLFLVASMAGEVAGGSLDPPGSPASTMKSLIDIPGSWNRMLSSSGNDSCNTARFDCIFADQAVLDHETGLVWQRYAASNLPTYATALDFCHNLAMENRKGWRLPAAHEMASLIDMAGFDSKLPLGHPFQSADFIFDPYFTTTPDPANAANIIAVTTATGVLAPWTKGGTPPDILERAWCVRSGDNP